MKSDPSTKIWDVIVVGTGIGGGTIGRRLAERGLSVLMVEKGPYGLPSEQHYLDTEMQNPAARLLRGFWPKPVTSTIDGRSATYYGPIGAGVGGTSAFYAATLERPEPHDLDDSSNRPHPTGGWPVSYKSLTPYFDEAERMFNVCGDADPLSEEPAPALRRPPSLTPDDQEMMASFQRSGLNPYHVHMGIRAVPGCLNCFGHKCPKQCKMDGKTAGVDPALATGNAELLTDCAVVAVHGNDREVSYLEADIGGRQVKLRASNYVLAAGGIGSPRLLLSSRSSIWPNGFANRKDLIGRNLMFHLTEMVAVWPARGSRSIGPTKAIALRDFYYVDKARFGALQAMGVEASYGMIVHHLNGVFDRSVLRRFRALREMTRVVGYVASRIFGKAKIFAGIIEDLPYAENRVTVDPDDPEQLSFEYSVAPELNRRRQQFRRILRRRLKGHRMAFLSLEPSLNIAHCCGTMRFGNDPETSVLDRDCRVHGIRNLYVTDSSFMPTSLGINPSLTIAANALRVGDLLADMSVRTRVKEASCGQCA
ncbi:GMC family oxidoreductase [Corticibacterium sp. UT-5YL-CI-8]|nr:GMC family oxidoreductase [Tianweitania sp. UT-5YL-CI-8]